jgi:proline dehydrogenase
VSNELKLVHDPDEIDRIFSLFDSKKTGYIDYIEWMKTIHLEKLWGLLEKNEDLRKYLLNEEEKKLMDSMVKRLKEIADYAAGLKVRLMIDAEQTYFQPAIDHIVLDLQRRYNTSYPCIFNTYQAYLKNSLPRVQNDIIRAQREGYFFAAKIVRGAYLVLERKRAQEKGYEDPIWPSLKDTHNNYHRVLDLVFQNMHTGLNVLVATHNQSSIEYTLQEIEKLNLSKDNIYFGQLLGMADNLTFILGRNGYKAYKYVPYGPINEVVPYLIRRVQENSNILSNAQMEKKMIAKEIFRRIFTGEFLQRNNNCQLQLKSISNNKVD